MPDAVAKYFADLRHMQYMAVRAELRKMTVIS